jgi:hypothetical protein
MLQWLHHSALVWSLPAGAYGPVTETEISWHSQKTVINAMIQTVHSNCLIIVDRMLTCVKVLLSTHWQILASIHINNYNNTVNPHDKVNRGNRVSAVTKYMTGHTANTCNKYRNIVWLQAFIQAFFFILTISV